MGTTCSSPVAHLGQDFKTASKIYLYGAAPRAMTCSSIVRGVGRESHLLLQTRVKTLNHELGAVFKRWYPDLEVEELPEAA